MYKRQVVDSGNFDWEAHADKFPGLCTPDESYHGLTNGLEYLPLDSLKKIRSPLFEIIYAEEEIVILPFGTPLEVLQHLKQTGVTGTEKRVWTRGRLQNFCNEYIRVYRS